MKFSLVLLLALLLVWGGFLIYRTSFVAEDGQRYFCLFDDAMISMTYARNLVEGYGLNWARQGEPVEGFTHPLWLVPMIGANLLPVDLRWRSLPVQLASLALLALLVVAVRRLMLSWYPGHWMPAAVMTGFCYSLVYWSLMGMETGLQALLAVLAVHLAFDSVEGSRERHRELWAVCAAAYLLRMDMLLLVAAVQAWVVLGGGLKRERSRWLAGLGLFLATVLGYELFRWLYFHDVLPNTYYLKLTGIPLGVRLLRGVITMKVFVVSHLPLLLAAGAGTALLLRRDRRLALPAGIFLLYCAYSVWVGGDAWDLDPEVPVRANRYISFVLPLLAVLLNAVLNQLKVGRWAAGAAALAGVLLLNEPRLMFATPPLVESHRTVMDQLHRLETIASPGASVASAWAGIPAYFSEFRMVDVLGYNDRYVAHQPSRIVRTRDDVDRFRPGHTKWDLDWLLGQVRPDVFFQVWGPRLEGRNVQGLMHSHGYVRRAGVWLRKDSEKVRIPERRRRRERRAAV